jgi:hypothetical protein
LGHRTPAKGFVGKQPYIALAKREGRADDVLGATARPPSWGGRARRREKTHPADLEETVSTASTMHIRRTAHFCEKREGRAGMIVGRGQRVVTCKAREEKLQGCFTTDVVTDAPYRGRL